MCNERPCTAIDPGSGVKRLHTGAAAPCRKCQGSPRNMFTLTHYVRSISTLTGTMFNLCMRLSCHDSGAPVLGYPCTHNAPIKRHPRHTDLSAQVGRPSSAQHSTNKQPFQFNQIRGRQVHQQYAIHPSYYCESHCSPRASTQHTSQRPCHACRTRKRRALAVLQHLLKTSLAPPTASSSAAVHRHVS